MTGKCAFDRPHTPLWCDFCWEQQRESQRTRSIDELAVKVGRLVDTLDHGGWQAIPPSGKQQQQSTPPRPRQEPPDLSKERKK
jgi:hypothetical protein